MKKNRGHSADGVRLIPEWSLQCVADMDIHGFQFIDLEPVRFGTT